MSSEKLDKLLKLVDNNYLSLEIFRKIYKIYLNENNISLALKYIDIAINLYNDIDSHLLKYHIFLKNENLNNIIFYLKQNDKLPFYLTSNYFLNLNEYSHLVNDIPINIIFDTKKEFRYFCYNCIKFINKLKPDYNLELNLPFETVLIEFRILPHLEFLIKNTIFKLKNKWSHTIVCGNNNYDFIVNICKEFNVKIIKLNINNLDIPNYNNLLTSLDFWNLFTGEKILLYQEDTFIFKSNIDEFIEWDYIGAPWPSHTTKYNLNVGNGGFSLRTKQVMIDIINTTNNISNDSEDLYFSLNMKKYNMGKVPSFIDALKFSTEFFQNDNSFGGHCFFLYNYKWKNLLFNNLKNMNILD